MLRDAGRDADAERWARRGLAGDPASYWADGLRMQLTGLLLASGRGEEAVAVHRAEFERRALRQDYSRLRETAERAGRTSDKYRYPKAIKALGRLRDAYQRAGDEAGFPAYLDELRQRQHRKTSFVAKLDVAFAAADSTG